MSFKVKFGPGNTAFDKSIDNISLSMKGGIRAGFFAIGSQLRQTARSQMLEKKNGELYPVPGRSRRVRASAPGQSPASRTGRLRRSIGYDISGDSMAFGAGGRGSGVGYAEFLEQGTGKMKARPLLLNSVTKNEAKIETLFNDAVADKLKAKR